MITRRNTRRHIFENSDLKLIILRDFQASTHENIKIQVLFKDIWLDSSTFQDKKSVQGLFKTGLHFQGLFKTVRTLVLGK